MFCATPVDGVPIDALLVGYREPGIKMKRLRISALALAGLLMILASGGAQAADLGIKAFFGNFQGGGVAEASGEEGAHGGEL